MSNPAIKRAAEILRSGGLVAFPTETVYGLGADATNAKAVARIFEAKNRPRFDPLIVHVPSLKEAKAVAHFSPLAESLAQAFWPGPLTLVLERKGIIPDIVTSGLSTVGVRVPAHPLALELLNECGCPVAAPSANPFGYVSPTTAQHVEQQLGAKVGMVLDGGPCRVGVESTVIRIVEEPALGTGIEVLRPGGLPQEELARFKGVSFVRVGQPVHEQPNAPGQLEAHYAPRVPVRLSAPANESAAPPKSQIGLLAFKQPMAGYGQVEVLSSSGSLVEAAASLFGALRRLDSSGCKVIEVELVPDEGLGRAINDRLRRAAAATASPNRTK